MAFRPVFRAPGRPAPRVSASGVPPPSEETPPSVTPTATPRSSVDPSLLQTLAALHTYNEELGDVAPGSAPLVSRKLKSDSPAPLHWLNQLGPSDLKGAAVFGENTLQSVKYLLHVFSFLEPNDLFKSAEVCKQWNVIADHDSNWEPHRLTEPKRMEVTLDNQRRRYLKMEKINIRVHVPAKVRRPKDFVINVRKHSKLWSDEAMVMRGFWAKKSEEKTKVAAILKSQQSQIESSQFHTIGDIKCVVVDNGSAFIRAGFSAEHKPSLVFPSRIAHSFVDGKDNPEWKDLPKLKADDSGGIMLKPMGTYGSLFGPEVHDLALSALPDAKQKSGRYSLKSLSFQDNESDSWDDWSSTYGYIYNSMRTPGKKDEGVDPSQHPILITQPIFAPRYVREKMSEILFEQFNVPALHVTWAPVAAAYGYDTLTGLSLDIGESGAQIVPIYHGTILEPQMRRVSHLGGDALSRYLLEHITSIRAPKFFPGEPPAQPGQEADFRAYQHTSLIRNIKERCARVSEHYSEEIKEMQATGFVREFTPSFPGLRNPMPISFGREALDCGELLLNPKSILGDNDTSIISLPELVTQVVNSCSVDLRADLLNNIVVSGGASEIKGLIPRLGAEIRAIYNDSSLLAKAVNIKAADDRSNSVWVGSAELARLGMGASGKHVWLTKETYEEVGAWGFPQERGDV